MEVTLNDTPLTRDGKVWRAPQALEPETIYELTLRFRETADSVDGGVVTQSFTTGTERAAGDRPPKPTIVGDEDATPAGDFSSWSACELYAGSVGCPDSGDPAWVRFETEPSSAVGWVIRAVDSNPEFDSLWPASCATDIVWRGYAHNDCFEATAIDSAGRLSDPVEHCVKNVNLRPGSCSAASAPASSPLWLALFALLVLRRRK